MVAGAAADVALQLLPNGILDELAAIAIDDINRRHDHSRRAISALQSVVIAKRGLHRMQFVALRDALDRDDVGAAGLASQHSAGLDRLAIDMHDAGTALAGVAADMGPGQVQIFTQQVNKKSSVLDI